jgi:hypothetical protein
MAIALYTYDVDNLSIKVGTIPITGFPKDDRITIETEEMDWSHTVGSDGNVVRTAKNNSVTKLTLRTLQESVSNIALYALRQLDRTTGLGVVPVNITYALANVPTPIFVSTASYIEKLPAPKHNNSDERVLEWIIIAVGGKHSPIITLPTPVVF